MEVMNEDSAKELDWTSLPPGTEVESLWDCLHDGELLSCRSDLIDRKVSLEFRVRHLQEEADDDLRFFLHLHNVRSVRANVYLRWPGEFVISKDASRDEECRLISEYQAKWREESIGWLSFEGSLSTDPLQISDADIARSSGKVALKLGGHLDGERFNDLYCGVLLRGTSISASRSDERPLSLEQFMEMGRRYWEEFSKRRKG
jgi:hypothetical protein